MNKVYDFVTERIIEQLEKGVAPWRKPWMTGYPKNWKSGKEYSGINVFLLQGGEYLTFKQVQEAGGHVKKGEKANMVIFWTQIEKEVTDSKTGETKKAKIPFLKYYNVFEVSQCEGIERKNGKGCEVEPITRCEEIVNNYTDKPEVFHVGGQAYYSPTEDTIHVPPTDTFTRMTGYYTTLFHEMAHSTGHSKRLAREGVTKPHGFGSDPYAKEELVAEMAAAMLSGIAGIEDETIENSAAYCQSWIRQFQSDKTLIVKAASAAQKAANWILGNKTNTAKEEE